MPIKANKVEKYDEHSRKGALAQNTINTFSVMAQTPDEYYTPYELIKLGIISDARNANSKAFKTGQTLETWYTSKLKVLSALGRYGTTYTDKKGVTHKPRPKYLDISAWLNPATKTKEPVFKINALGLAKLNAAISTNISEDLAEDEDDEDGA